MRKQISKRILQIALTVAMAVCILPATAFADTSVEYFSSTLYNWDEDLANAATAEADISGEASYTRASNVNTNSWSNTESYTSSGYYYFSNETYYLVYYTKIRGDKGNTTTTLYYTTDGTNYTSLGTSVSSITLYSRSANYEGKGLYFTNGTITASSVPAFSQWADSDQNWKIYSGLAQNNLSDAINAPFSNSTVNAASLFATDGSNTSYTDVYTNVGVPFVYDSETGYYTFDSDEWGVYFSGGTGASNTNMLIADKPAAYESKTGFFPFNSLSDTTVDATKGTTSGSTSSYVISDDAVFGFGMVTSVNFTMTESGQIENADGVLKDIIFEFAGDDDVWVYIDNILVLDIGGTHDAITGTINFNSGDLTLTAGAYSNIADLAGTYTSTSGNTMSQGNLYDDKLCISLEDFANGGIHTLTIYYMERGRGRSNCKIEFNLPQTDTVSVTKELNTTDSEDRALTSDDLEREFTFTLYKNGSPVTDTAYIVQNANGVIVNSDGKTGEDGTFTLKGGQTAVFDLSLDGERTYYVVETNPYDSSDEDSYYKDPTWTYTYSSNISDAETYENSSAWSSDSVKVTGSMKTAESLTFVCTNTKGYVPDVEVKAEDDVVVIDYNLPVTVDVLENDTIIGTITKLEISQEGSYGDSVVTDECDITYTLKQVLSAVDSVKYTVTAEDEVDGTTATGTAILSVVPASSVYYEDNFVTDDTTGVVGITFGNTYSWVTVSGDTSSESDSQSSDNVIYGTDAAYADDTTYSNGSATSAQSGATATFTFTGTGVDIYSSTDSDACIVYVYLYSIANDGTETMVQYAVSNNYAADGKYYVVPTVTFENLDYGTYKIKLRVVKSSTDDDAVNYYLDGIRVYNPLGTVTNDGSVAGTAYAAANELNAVFTELRSMLLDGSAELQGENDTEGVIFIDEMTDGSTGQTTTQISTYENLIAEHEVYLSSGNGIAFTLGNFEDGDAVYVGIKLTGIYEAGATGSVSKVEVTNGDGEKAEIEITSTMDQYYKITPDSDGNVVIMNTSENGAVISLTKVRTTSPETNDITFVSDEGTVTYALATFRTLTTTAYSNEVLTEEEVTEQTEAETTEVVESEDETETVETEDSTEAETEAVSESETEVQDSTETESDASGNVEIENPDSSENSNGSGSQNNFSSIFDKIAGWMSGRR